MQVLDHCQPLAEWCLPESTSVSNLPLGPRLDSDQASQDLTELAKRVKANSHAQQTRVKLRADTANTAGHEATTSARHWVAATAKHQPLPPRDYPLGVFGILGMQSCAVRPRPNEQPRAGFAVLEWD
jgi:hypothetical protein